MVDFFTDCDDSTPLTEEEKKGLKAKWVTTRRELNELETQGVINAEIWLMSNNKRNILRESFIKTLHKKMFGDVWVWAGKFRITERNIGIKAYKIQESLKILLDDVNYWIINNTFSKKEIAVRLHHRLVQIHPFPNGNGRISRLMADLFMERFGSTKLGD
jgi:Fic-DOC domain mobile mystery protein B